MKIKLRRLMPFITVLLMSVSLLQSGCDCGGKSGGGDPAVTSVTVTPASAIIAFSETQQFTATANFDDGSSAEITSDTLCSWSSDNTSVADVDASGMVTANGTAGAITVSATYEGFTGTASIEVRDPATIVTGLTMPDPSSIGVDGTIDADANQQFTITITYQDGSTSDVSTAPGLTWASSDPSVATITTGGLVEGVNNGTTTITATLDGQTATFLLTVADPLRSIAITPANTTIQFNGTQQYTATGTYASGDTGDITAASTWASSDETIAAIDAAGQATALEIAGATTITASLDGITSNSATLNTAAGTLTALTISAAGGLSINATDTLQFTALADYSDGRTGEDVTGSVAWATSNGPAVSIDVSGLATGVNDGSADITASLSGVTSNTVTVVVADPLVSIDISPNSATIEPGNTQQYTAQGTYMSGDTADIRSLVTWNSTDTGIATLDGNGLATAGSTDGSTTITASLSGITSDSATLIVDTPITPTGIVIAPASATIDADGTQQFSAIVSFTEGPDQVLTGSSTWTSSTPAAATINASGLATGVTAGSTTITASYTQNGVTVTDTSSLTVNNPLRSIDISPDAISIDADGTQQYTAQGTYADGTTPDISALVTWNSSEAGVAAIDASGLASGVNDGTSNITATLDGITSDTAVLMVNDPIRSLDISPNSATINPGETQQYLAEAVRASGDRDDVTASVVWSSDTPGVAAIDAAGLASALIAGSTDISATYSGFTSDVATLTVSTALPVSIAISSSGTSIDADGTMQFTAIVTYNDASTVDESDSVTWTSATPAAATIDATGLAAGVAAGSTTISCEKYGLTSNSITLTVSNPLRSIAVSPATATIDADASQQYTATGTYADGSTADITSSATWSSSAAGVATINATGLADGVNNGSSNITATLDGVISNTAVLTVNDPLRSITISSPDGAIDLSVTPVTEQYTATGTYASGDAADISATTSWASSNGGVATISASGLATGVNDGTTNITASLDGVTSNTAVLTVTDPPVSLAIAPATASIIVGNDQQYAATVTYASGDTADVSGSATWSSTDTGVASISSAGLASSSAVGSTTISANFSGIDSNNATLTVTNDVIDVTISPDSNAIDAGTTQQYTAIATYQDATTGDVTASVTWDSTDTGVATISSSGLAAAAAAGTTDITATLDGVTSNLVTLTVNAAGNNDATLSGLVINRGNSASNTQLELWSDAQRNSGSVISFAAGTTSYYVYIAGVDQVTITATATDSNVSSMTIDGAAATSGIASTVTVSSQGENSVPIVVTAEDGSTTQTYTVTVRFLTSQEWYWRVYAPGMTLSKEGKWFAIVPEPGVGTDVTINGNTGGALHWQAGQQSSLQPTEAQSTADECCAYFGDASVLDGNSFFAGRSWMLFTSPYNDGNGPYSGNQEGNAWSGDWYAPSNEGGMNVTGDMVGETSLSGDGEQRGILTITNADGVVMAQIYIHYRLVAKAVAIVPESYVAVIYMPGTSYELTSTYIYEDDPGAGVSL